MGQHTKLTIGGCCQLKLMMALNSSEPKYNDNDNADDERNELQLLRFWSVPQIL